MLKKIGFLALLAVALGGCYGPGYGYRTYGYRPHYGHRWHYRY